MRNWSEVSWELRREGVEADLAEEKAAGWEGVSFIPQFCSTRVPIATN